MKSLETICIMCPVGCHLTIKKQKGNVLVEGNKCPRGAEYGASEYVCPKRNFSTTIEGKAKRYSVKTANPVEKKDIFACQAFIKKQIISSNLKVGDVVCIYKKTNIVVTGIMPK